jgi:putative tricarboxylic transport membrane protein
MRANLITAILLIAFAIVFWFAADTIPKSRLGGTVGADGLPKLLAVALGVLSVGLIVQTLLTARTAEAVPTARPERKREDRIAHLRAVGMIVIGAGYLAMVPYLGYLPSVALLLAVVALYNGKRPSLGLAAFAIVGAVVFYLLFVQLLDVPLPAGLWPRLLG